MADRVVVINEGKLMQFATPSELYASPKNTFVASFIGGMNFMTAIFGALVTFSSARLKPGDHSNCIPFISHNIPQSIIFALTRFRLIY